MSGKLKRYRDQEVNHLKDSEHRWIEVCAGYFCNGWNHKPLLHPYLQKLVVPVPEIQKKIDFVLSNFTSNTLGIHVRKRYGGHPEKTFAKAEEFIDCYDNAKIFLCTDNEKYIAEFDRYGDRVITVPQFHKNRSVEGMREALVDFVLLSRCHEMVGTHGSSFSEMAAMLNETKREISLV